MIFAIPRSLEDIRNDRLLSKREFTQLLGITEQTYRRLIERDPTVENPTKRRIAERLDLPPHLLIELLPPPSPAYLAAITEEIRASNEAGWFAYEPTTGMLAEEPSTVICPPEPADV